MQGSPNQYSKFRWVLPTSYLTCWLSLFLGPFLFPNVLESLFTLINYYGIMRLLYMIGCAAIGLYKVLTLPRYKKDQFVTDVHYAWVIPSYREPEEVIGNTLQQLAKHTRSNDKYLVFLAMEEHQKGSKEKAERVIAKYKHHFDFMGLNVHRIKEGEAKGKASNVSSCVENFERILPVGKYDMEKLFITIMDCDSFAPNEYIDEVNAYIYKNPEKSRKCVFNPTQIFKRNDQEVPVTTRSFDNYHCYAHWTTSVSYFEVSAPFSNYTLNYQLIKNAGFWDKHADAIGEDMHTFNKLYWVYQSDVYSVTIHAPFNQLNVQCDGSYFDNVKEKFWQAVRHGQGIQEVSYNLNGFSSSKKSTKDFIFIYYFLDTVMFHTCFTTFVILFQGMRQAYFMFQTAPLTAFQKATVLEFESISTLSLVLNFISIIMYELYKRYSNKRFYGGKNESWTSLWEYFVFLGFGLYAFFASSFLWATFKGLFKTIEYRVGAKTGSPATSTPVRKQSFKN